LHKEESFKAKLWEINEYIDIAFELDLPRHLNLHQNTFMISFGFENANFTEIGTFARTQSGLVHFQSYTQPGTLKDTEGNADGRIRDGKTWEGVGHFEASLRKFYVRARRLFKNREEQRILMEQDSHAIAVIFKVENFDREVIAEGKSKTLSLDLTPGVHEEQDYEYDEVTGDFTPVNLPGTSNETQNDEETSSATTLGSITCGVLAVSALLF